MAPRITRPKYIRDQVRQEAALSRLTSAALTLVGARAQPTMNTARIAELEYGLHHAGFACLSAKCSREQVEAALDKGGLGD